MLKNDNLDAIMQTIFRSWFVDFEPFSDALVSSQTGKRFPKDWHESTLGEYVTYAQGTQVPVEDQYEHPSKDRMRFLRIVDYTGTTSIASSN